MRTDLFYDFQNRWKKCCEDIWNQWCKISFKEWQCNESTQSLGGLCFKTISFCKSQAVMPSMRNKLCWSTPQKINKISTQNVLHHQLYRARATPPRYVNVKYLASYIDVRTDNRIFVLCKVKCTIIWTLLFLLEVELMCGHRKSKERTENSSKT
jgi:hypothetical protein